MCLKYCSLSVCGSPRGSFGPGSADCRSVGIQASATARSKECPMSAASQGCSWVGGNWVVVAIKEDIAAHDADADDVIICWRRPASCS